MIHETLTQGPAHVPSRTFHRHTLGAFVFGLVLGTMLALMRLSSVGPYRWIATTYIEFFRGLPAIVVFIAFGLPAGLQRLVIPFDPYGTVWIAGTGGCGIHGRDDSRRHPGRAKGQVEAARSLGMPTGTATRKIVLPQAFRIITTADQRTDPARQGPPRSTSWACPRKASNSPYGRAIANTNANLTPLVIAGFCYLLITLPLSMVVRRMEARQKKER